MVFSSNYLEGEDYRVSDMFEYKLVATYKPRDYRWGRLLCRTTTRRMRVTYSKCFGLKKSASNTRHETKLRVFIKLDHCK